MEKNKNLFEHKADGLATGIVCVVLMVFCLVAVAVSCTGNSDASGSTGPVDIVDEIPDNSSSNTVVDEGSESDPIDTEDATLPSDTAPTDPPEETTPTETHKCSFVATETVVPTCTEDGYTILYCNGCGAHITQQGEAAKGHSWSDWKMVTQPTVYFAGEEERTCYGCTAKEMRAVDKLDTPETEPPVETTSPKIDNTSWNTAPGTRPYEYQEIFGILVDEYCNIYYHCDRYGNAWIDRNEHSDGYGKTIYTSVWFANSNLHYYGEGVWSNFGAYWSEDGSRQGGSFSMSNSGSFNFDDLGSGTPVAPYGPVETLTGYMASCNDMAYIYETIMATDSWSDEEKAETFSAMCKVYGVTEADVMGYMNAPTTHPFPGVE